MPPKKYLLPPRETVLTYSSKTRYRLTEAPAGPSVLLGLHACDLAAIGYLDLAFRSSSEPDPLYLARRKLVTLIGVSCTADDFCFCGEVTPEATVVPFDLFMHQSPPGFFLETGSDAGNKLLARLQPLLVDGDFTSAPNDAQIKRRIDAAAERRETFPESPLWDDFASRCLSCGACSLCCPTCYCFDTREHAGLEQDSAARTREWDNCLFGRFGTVAGGQKFRKRRQERFHYRFQHKYLGFGAVRGVVACVGCGRCREVCPARIDLMELFKEQCHG